MSSASRPVKGATVAMTVVFITAALWILRGYLWPTLSNVEVGPLQARLDPSLFRNDFTVQESLRFSPRFYYNELILLPARLGLPLEWSVAMWHVAALALFVVAGHAIATTLRLGTFTSAVLMTGWLTLHVGVLGAVFLYTHAPVPSVWAGALALGGAACALRGRFAAAFAWFGAASLLQFLVGFYAGLLALPALARATPGERFRAAALWGAGLALVYVPLWIAGRADAGALDGAAFVEVYAQLRHPHHLVPSSWPVDLWLRTLLFYAGAWYFLRRTSSDRPAFERSLLHATLALTAAALAVNVVFVELHPLPLIAKLQPARITPLAQAIVLGLLATRVQSAVDHRNWLLALLLAATPFSLYPGPVLAVAAILGRPGESRRELATANLVLAGVVILAFDPFGVSPAWHLGRHLAWMVLLLVQLVPAALARQPLALGAATAAAIIAAATTARASLQPGWSGPLARRFSVDAPPGDAPAILGRRFRDRSAPDALVLVPPTSEPWSFKLYARRAVVVDDKNIPFTSAGLKEWHDRMERVLGVPFTRGVDAEAAWRARSPAALRELARHYRARFLLTRDEWHPAVMGRRIDTEQGWSLWELAPES